MSQATTLPWTIPAEVQAFAEEQGIRNCLPTLVEATERVFPSARRRAIVLEPDPEIPDLHFVVVEVDVPFSNEEALRARRQWHDAIRQCCSATPRYAFCLRMDLIP